MRPLAGWLGLPQGEDGDGHRVSVEAEGLEGSPGALSCCYGGFKTTSPLCPSAAFNKQDILRSEQGWPASLGEHCPP